MANIDEIRGHLLWTVCRELKRLTDAFEKHQQRLRSRSVIQQVHASVGMARLRPKILWWSDVKSGIESDDPARALPALERLIRHYRWVKFRLMLPSEHLGFQLLVLASISRTVDEAKLLFEHHQRHIA